MKIGVLFAAMMIACSADVEQSDARNESLQQLSDDVRRIRQAINSNIFEVLLYSKERGPDDTQFKLFDEELTDMLARRDALPMNMPEMSILQRPMRELDARLAGDVLTFYSKAFALTEAVERHVLETTHDARAVRAGQARQAAIRTGKKRNAYMHDQPYPYAIFIEIGRGGFGAHLIEVGPPVCQDGRVSKRPTCNRPIGFSYREDSVSGSGWRPMELGGPEGDMVRKNKMIPLIPNGLFDALVKGSEASVAEVAYMRRVHDLNDRAMQLMELGVYIEGKLAILQLAPRSPDDDRKCTRQLLSEGRARW